MGNFAKTISSKIKDFITCTVEKNNGYMIAGEMVSTSGDDSPPLKGDVMYISETDGAGEYVVLGTIVKSQGAKAGEKILFSRNSSKELVAKIYMTEKGSIEIETEDAIKIHSKKEIEIQGEETFTLKASKAIEIKGDDALTIDGQSDIKINSGSKIVLNDGADYAVKFNELDLQMKRLKTELTELLTSLKTHTHTGNMGAPTSPPVPPIITPVQISLDVSQAKSQTVQIP